MLKLSILSDPRKLAKVRDKIKRISAEAGFGKNDTYNIVLSVDEALTNIIRHSYSNDFTKKIIVCAETKGTYLKIIIRSYGKKFDYKKTKGRLPKKLKPGGLGIFFIKNIMDDVIYDTSRKRLTKLTLVKRLPKL
jgi:anti-sigma regulatory factor (Ser/Thr protein kinase)